VAVIAVPFGGSASTFAPPDDVIHRHRLHEAGDRFVIDRQRVLGRITADDLPGHRVGFLARDGKRFVGVRDLRLIAATTSASARISVNVRVFMR
jgi:hypothetical protein